MKDFKNLRQQSLHLPLPAARHLTMGIEIERKFLVNQAKWKAIEKPEGLPVQQGYICTAPEKSVRVRMAGRHAFLTIKGETTGLSRPEFEYEIPYEDARQLLQQLCGQVISKIRYRIPYGAHLWEVDVFEKENEGLIIAEVELASENAAVQLPEWVSEEVTGIARYYNASLANSPYQSWERP